MRKKKKRSLFERITGSVKMDEFDDDLFDDEDEDEEMFGIGEQNEKAPLGIPAESKDENTGQLSVDVINQPDDIVIRAVVAGVKPHELDVQISRDMVIITGTRTEEYEVDERDYYHRELEWGSFSRSILLPEEIDVELSTAQEKHGVLELRLTKIDRHKKTKLQVKTG